MFRPSLVIISVALFAASCGSPPADAPVEGAEGLMTASAGASLTESSAVPGPEGAEVSPETVAREEAEQQIPPASTPDEPSAFDGYGGDAADRVGDESNHAEPVDSEETSNGTEPTDAEEPRHSGLVGIAIADLADRLGIDESTITVVSFDAVVWPDGSLGCPQPGMEYIQVLVDGSLIVLSVEGREYRYHSGAGRAPFLCLKPVING